MSAHLLGKQEERHIMVGAPRLIQWSGPASVLGAVLLVAQIALSSALGSAQGTSNPYEIYNTFLYVVYNLLFDAALLLFAVGLVGLYARQAERFGRLGRVGLLLALGAGALIVVSLVATLMAGLRPALFVPVAFFTQLLATLFLVVGLVFGLVLLVITTVRAATLRDWISSLGWRGALLILAAGLAAALLSDVTERIINSSYLGLKGNHLLHVLVTIPVAAWVARRVGMAPIFYGTLAGLISGIANQIFNHALLQPGTMRWYEIAIILISCVAAGCLGGIIARSTMAEQETLYKASQAIGVVALATWPTCPVRASRGAKRGRTTCGSTSRSPIPRGSGVA